MSTALIVIVLAVATAVVALLALRRGDQPADLGVVSHQWIAEHRLGSGQDSRR
jgi:hypothetical protein